MFDLFRFLPPGDKGLLSERLLSKELVRRSGAGVNGKARGRGVP